MSVYVDPIIFTQRSKRWPFAMACHLYADTPEELKTFVTRVGIPETHFYDHVYVPRFAITATQRLKAVGAGALEVDRQYVEKVLLRRKAVHGYN